MSTVLWSNVLVNGVVSSDESDKYALYKHSKKLNKISNELNILPFESMQDFTDLNFNLSDEDLPEGMESTNDLMAKEGVWVSGDEAVSVLERLLDHVSSKKIKFGLFSNDIDRVVNELKESLVFAEKAKNGNGQFNFSVVM